MNKEMNNIENLFPKVITSKGTVEEFNGEAIIISIIRETKLERSKCIDIVKKVCKKIISSNINHLTAPMIRELVCSELLESGYEKARFCYTRLGLPLYDFGKLINSGLTEEEKKDVVYAQIEREYYEILKLYKNGE